MTPRRATRALAHAGVALALIVTGCSRGRTPAPPGATTPRVAEDSSRVRTSSAASFQADDSRYRITSTTVSAQLSGDSARRDSTVRAAGFHAVLIPQRPYGFSLQLIVEDDTSEGRAAARRRRGQGTTDSLVATLQMGFDTLGRRSFAAPVPALADAGQCARETGIVSPLVGRLLATPPVLLAAGNGQAGEQMVVDSLSYIACSSGVGIHTTMRIEMHAGEANTVLTSIRGELRGDSSHALPMRISGTFSGTATVSGVPSRRALADSLSLRLDLRLVAESAVKRQEFTQLVRTTVVRQDRAPR